MPSPTNRQYTILGPNGQPYEVFSCTSTSSMVNGKVDLSKQQPHSLLRGKVDYQRYNGNVPSGEHPLNASNEPYVTDFTKVEQIALAKFNGRLRKGSASLGVTLASWKQSRDMIQSRLSNLQQITSPWEKKAERWGLSRKRIGPNGLASAFLEGEFGWVPLIGDIKSALTTVCQDGVPPSWVKGVHFENVNTQSVSVGGGLTTTHHHNGILRTTVCGAVRITNPNLWLLNRMGLINPATVAWDLVPWSFVVNMFVNVNAMLNSFTNELGIQITDKSVTNTSNIGTLYTRVHQAQGWSVSSATRRKRKVRTVGAIPTVKWQVRVPDFSLETAAIAASLLVQRMSKIARLIS